MTLAEHRLKLHSTAAALPTPTQANTPFLLQASQDSMPRKAQCLARPTSANAADKSNKSKRKVIIGKRGKCIISTFPFLHCSPTHSLPTPRKTPGLQRDLRCTVVPVYSTSLNNPKLLRCPPALPLAAILLRQPSKYTKPLSRNPSFYDDLTLKCDPPLAST